MQTGSSLVAMTDNQWGILRTEDPLSQTGKVSQIGDGAIQGQVFRSPAINKAALCFHLVTPDGNITPFYSWVAGKLIHGFGNTMIGSQLRNCSARSKGELRPKNIPSCVKIYVSREIGSVSDKKIWFKFWKILAQCFLRTNADLRWTVNCVRHRTYRAGSPNFFSWLLKVRRATSTIKLI